MPNYNVIAKGKYTHKQTSDVLKIERFLIVRRKKSRLLLLDVNNCAEENLTGLLLQIDQFDVRGKSLGSIQTSMKDLSQKPGTFVLKKEIEIHRSCIDFHVQVISAEYGNYVYRLGENDTYVTYDKPEKKENVDRKAIRRKLGNRNFVAKERTYKTPVFVSLFIAGLLTVGGALGAYQVYEYRAGQERAHRQEFTLNSLKYQFVDQNYNDSTPVNVIGYEGLGSTKLEIPATIEGHPVAAIAPQAFEGDLILEEITIAKNVQIGSRAFAGCEYLKSVTLQGDNVIGAEAFLDCSSLTSFTAGNLTSVGRSAFQNCKRMRSFTVNGIDDETPLSFGVGAFNGCVALHDISIKKFINYGNNIALFPSAYSIANLYLRNYDYKGYYNGEINLPLNALFGGKEVDIQNVHLGFIDEIPADFTVGCEEKLTSFKADKITSTAIGDRAFNNCRNLQSVQFPKTITEIGERAFAETDIASFDGSALKKLGAGAFLNCEKLTEFKLLATTPLSVIDIDAFYGCEGLLSLNIPKDVETIGSGAMSGCESLTSVTFANKAKLKNIMADAFYGCTALTEVTLPDNLNVVGENAFSECRQLRYLTIGKGDVSISANAFENCYKLYEIENNSNANIHVGYGIAKNAFRVYTSVTDTRLEKVKANGVVYAEKNSEWYAIDYQGVGGRVEFTNALDGRAYKIIDYLFDGNTTVTEVYFTYHAQAFGGNVFGNSAVKTVIFNDESLLIDVQSDTFRGSSIQAVDFGGRSLREFHTNLFEDCVKLKSVKLPYNASKIPAATFLGCTALESVTSKVAVNNVGDSAFSGCVSLKNFQMNNDGNTAYNASIGNRAFYDCVSLDTFVTDSSLNAIGDEAFYNCKKLTNVEIVWLYSLGYSAFENCTGLKTISINGIMSKVEDSTFRGCSRLENVILPNQTMEIGENAFRECYALKKIQLPSEITSIGANAFRDDTALEHVYGDIVRVIGERAFFGCEKLESVATQSIESIGMEAFRDCERLDNVYFAFSLAYIGERAFYNCESLTEAGMQGYYLLEIPDSAFENCVSLEMVQLPESLTRIGDDAFLNCPVLHEVYNLSYLNAVENSKGNGYVAYNALVVNSSSYAERLTKETIGKFTYKHRGGEWFLVDYSGKDKYLNLGHIDNGSNYYYDYTIARYAFEDCGNAERITLGSSVAGMRDQAFSGLSKLKEIRFVDSQYYVVPSNAFSGCMRLSDVVISSSLGGISFAAFDMGGLTIYYTGTRNEWQYASANYDVSYNYVYYYYVCVHDYFTWTYDGNNNISRKYKAYKYEVFQEPTCRTAGWEREYCKDCGYNNEYQISAKGHDYNKYNTCDRCGYVYNLYVTKSSLSAAKKLIDIVNDEVVPYDLFKSSSNLIYVTAKNAYETSTLQIVAKEETIINFYVNVGDENGIFMVRYLGQTEIVTYDNVYRSFSYRLYAGEKITITYNNAGEEIEGSSKSYIESMRITSGVEPY